MAMEAWRATLAGLTAVNVQVEPINADAERDGLTRADLAADVEAALGAARIEVVTTAELFAETIDTPVLHLDLMTVFLEDSYAYSLRLELWQAVRLLRDPGVRALAMTWSGPQLVGVVADVRVAELRKVVRAAVDEFTRDCRAAGAARDG
jgi:hypothetical protein